MEASYDYLSNDNGNMYIGTELRSKIAGRAS